MRFNTLTKTILVFFLWVVCIYKIFIDYDHEYLTDSIIHTSLIIIASLTSAFVINSDYSRYKQTKKLTSFISSTTILFCVTGLLLTIYHLKKQDDTPSILYATKNTAGLGTITIDFRENNTFKFGRHHFLSANYTRGHYIIKDSLVLIEKFDFPDELKSDRLLLRTIPLSDSIKKKKQNGLLTLLFGKSQIDTTAETFLFQIDKKGEILESSISFKVVEKLLN